MKKGRTQTAVAAAAAAATDAVPIPFSPAVPGKAEIAVMAPVFGDDRKMEDPETGKQIISRLFLVRLRIKRNKKGERAEP